MVKQQKQQIDKESHPAPSKQPKLENGEERNEPPPPEDNLDNVEVINHDSNSISGVEAADADEEPDPDQKVHQQPKVVKVKGSDALTNLMQEYDETDKFQEQINKFKAENEELKSKVQKGQDQIKFLNEVLLKTMDFAISGGSGTQKLGSEFWKYHGEMVLKVS